MALINCPECDHKVSDTAKTCPSCGYNIEAYLNKINMEQKKQEEAEAAKKRQQDRSEFMAKNKKKFIICFAICAVCVIAVCIYVGINNYLNSDEYKYKNAINAYNNKDYDSAINALHELGDYKDSKQIIENSKPEYAQSLFNQGKFQDCEELLNTIISEDKKIKALRLYTYYEQAIQKTKDKDCESAIFYFKNINNFIRENKDIQLSDYTNFNQGTYENARLDCAKMAHDKGLELYKAHDYVGAAICFNFCDSVDIRLNYNDKECIAACRKIDSFQGTLYILSYTGGDKYGWPKDLEVSKSDYITVDGVNVNFNITDSNLNSKKSYTFSDIDLASGYPMATFNEDPSLHIKFDAYDVIIWREDEKNRYTKYYRTEEGLQYIVDIEDRKYKPEIGMTKEEVLNSTWGKPKDINTSTYAWGTSEQWCYSNYRYLYFDDGILTSIQE